MKIPVTNNTAMPIYVGAAMVHPGETRLFEDHQVPEHLRPVPAQAEVKAPEKPPADPIAELGAKPAPDLIAALPTLKDEELSQLEELEKSREKPRKTVLEAIVEEMLKRAGAAKE